MSNSSVFKYNQGYYYIGTDADTFLFVKYKDCKEYVYFRNENGVQTIPCQLFTYNFKIANQFDSTKHEVISFIYLFKSDKIKDIKFEFIAEAFVHFLELIKCPFPILASIIFAKSYCDDKRNVIFMPPIISNIFPYDAQKKYCLNPVNVFYYIFCAKANPMFFQKSLSNISEIKQNLQNLIKIIIYVCPNEIKTIKDELAKLFIEDYILCLDNENKKFFIVSYYLLSESIIYDSKKPKYCLMSPCSKEDDINFLQKILPNKINCHNFWAFPAFLLVTNPDDLFDNQKKISFRFLDEQKCIMNSILNSWASILNSQAPKKKLSQKLMFWNNTDRKISISDYFINEEELIKKTMTSFNNFIKAVVQMPSSDRKGLSIIRNELKKLSDNLTFVTKNISKYNFEDLQASNQSISQLYTLMYQKSGGDLTTFWSTIDGDIKESDIKTRETIFAYITQKYNEYNPPK